MMSVAQAVLFAAISIAISVGGTVGFAVWQFGWPS